jgi:hypothetical protein
VQTTNPVQPLHTERVEVGSRCCHQVPAAVPLENGMPRGINLRDPVRWQQTKSWKPWLSPEESQQDSTGAGSSRRTLAPQDVYHSSHNETFVQKMYLYADDHLRVVHHRLHQQLCIRSEVGRVPDAQAQQAAHDHQSGRIAESDPDMFAQSCPTQTDA